MQMGHGSSESHFEHIYNIYTKRTVNILISNWREVRLMKFTVEVPYELQKSFGAHA